MPHVADQAEAVHNVHCWLRHGGQFAGTVPIPGHAHAADDPTVRFLDREQLHDLLWQTGFDPIFIMPTGSVNEDDPPVSLYFRAVKP